MGFPNAGKSTLLKAFAPTKEVKIANSPFTTTKPQVCHIAYKNEPNENTSIKQEQFSLSVADLPGLIEGSSENHGCGHAFLKHLEYSEMLVIVTDVFGFLLGLNHSLPSRYALLG